MLDKIDLTKCVKSKEFKSVFPELQEQLAALQRESRQLGIPVIVIFEGWSAAGKGTLINEIILPLEPRYLKVHTIKTPSEDEVMRPFLWRFWTKTPERGKFVFFDRSWYRRISIERQDKQMTPDVLQTASNDILSFEQQLTDDGVVIIKLFLHLSEQEQHDRLKKLESSPITAWRVTDNDWKNHKRYDEYWKIYDEMLERTDSDYAPWTVIEATDRNHAAIRSITTIIHFLNVAIENARKNVIPSTPPLPPPQTSILGNIDLTKTMKKSEYSDKLSDLQDDLRKLHNKLYVNRVPLLIVFEGSDAAGKGGAIKRLAQALDPRGYEVVPTAAPTSLEKSHHYMWRFWNSMPKAGHIAIFDRSWYGRVLVERIEGFCTTDEWQRAYREINDMEAHITNFGGIIIKFWMQIDMDEQEKRFNQRLATPQKEWKMTDEDWRNRSKWDEYAHATNDMIVRTSTTYAPWTIVEANSKYYARIKVLETVVDALKAKFKRI